MRWTNDVDIFAKPFLIIPINHAFHWFLIVCMPGQAATLASSLVAEAVHPAARLDAKFDGVRHWVSEAIHSYPASGRAQEGIAAPGVAREDPKGGAAVAAAASIAATEGAWR